LSTSFVLLSAWFSPPTRGVAVLVLENYWIRPAAHCKILGTPIGLERRE